MSQRQERGKQVSDSGVPEVGESSFWSDILSFTYEGGSMKLQHGLALFAALALLVPEVVEGQRAGSIELGATGRYTAFDGDLAGIDNALGIGGRLGIFVLPNLSVEADWTYAEPGTDDVYLGRDWISHELISARLLYNYHLSEQAAILFGGGYSYDNFTRPRRVGPRGGGPAGLLGFRYSFTDRLSARFEGTGHFVPEDEDAMPTPRPSQLNLGVQAGVSMMFRHQIEERVEQLPAPPPDTVIVEREVEPPLPTGEPASICLATGESVEILITPQGDTLVGPQRVSVQDLGPGVAFEGAYADGRDWFVQDEAIDFEDHEYVKFGGEVSLDCPDIQQVGEWQGVPLFAEVGAEEPYETLYVPVRPGVWQAYETTPEVRG